MTESLWYALGSVALWALVLMGLCISALVIRSFWPVYLAGCATVAVPWLAWSVWRRRREVES